MWNLNTITNWLVGGITPTAYQEVAPPGDSVVFNDLGSGLVLLSNTVNPVSMVISNVAKSYTIQGSGNIAGATGITKDGTNAATITLVGNSYSGKTAVQNGALNLMGAVLGEVVVSTNQGASLNFITNAVTIGSLTGGATPNGNVTFKGALTLGGNNLPTVFNGDIDGTNNSFTKNGTNSVTFGGNVTNTGTVNWNSGELNVQSNWISGAVNYNADGGNANVAGYWRTAAFNKYDTNTLNITGTLTNTADSNYRFGTVTVASNAVLSSSGALLFAWVANNTNTVNVYGTMISSSGWFCLGGSPNSVGTMNIYPGAYVKVAGSGATFGANGGSNQVATVNMYGGTYTNLTGNQHIGENGTAVGTFNQYAGDSGFGDLNLGRNTNCTGVFNLYGGILIQRGNTMRIGDSPNATTTGGTGVFTITNGFADLNNVLVEHQNGDGTFNVLGGTVRVRGTMSLGSGTTAVESGTARLNVGSGGTLTARILYGGHGGGASPSVKNAYINNSGTITITNGGNWDVSRWDGVHTELEQNAGEIKFLGNSFLQFNGSTGNSISWINHNGGNITFYSDNAGTIPGGTGSMNMDANANGISTNTYNLNGGILTIPRILQTDTDSFCTFNFNGGTLKAAASSTTFLQGLSAAVVQSAANIDTTNNNITIAQPLLDGGSGGGLTKKGTGTLILSGTNAYSGLTTVSNGLLAVNGIIASPVAANGGQVGGNGIIAGTVTVNAGGGIAPGNNSIAVVTVNGDLTLNAGSTNVFDLNATTNDSVALGASVTYGGVLKIVNTNVLTAGQNFTLFTGAGAISASAITNFVCAANPQAVFSFTNGVLSVVSYVTINTNPPQMQVSVSGGNMTLSWPTNAGWLLQWQTNSLSTGLSTNWVTVPGSESITTTNIPIIATNPSVFYRLKLP